MRFRLLCVGKPKDAALDSLHDRYAERIVRLGVDYAAQWVPDVRSGSRLDEEPAREREGRRLLRRLDATAGRLTLVALDPGGELIRTEQLAERLGSDAAPWTLVVGGPLGLHRHVLERADWSWSLSRLTFPHELVRCLVAEQLYRGLTILRGIPYHK